MLFSLAGRLPERVEPGGDHAQPADPEQRDRLDPTARPIPCRPARPAMRITPLRKTMMPMYRLVSSPGGAKWVTPICHHRTHQPPWTLPRTSRPSSGRTKTMGGSTTAAQGVAASSSASSPQAKRTQAHEIQGLARSNHRPSSGGGRKRRQRGNGVHQGGASHVVEPRASCSKRPKSTGNTAFRRIRPGSSRTGSGDSGRRGPPRPPRRARSRKLPAGSRAERSGGRRGRGFAGSRGSSPAPAPRRRRHLGGGHRPGLIARLTQDIGRQ